jgi:hypothetical protein
MHVDDATKAFFTLVGVPVTTCWVVVVTSRVPDATKTRLRDRLLTPAVAVMRFTRVLSVHTKGEEATMTLQLASKARVVTLRKALVN